MTFGIIFFSSCCSVSEILSAKSLPEISLPEISFPDTSSISVVSDSALLFEKCMIVKTIIKIIDC